MSWVSRLLADGALWAYEKAWYGTIEGEEQPKNDYLQKVAKHAIGESVKCASSIRCDEEILTTSLMSLDYFNKAPQTLVHAMSSTATSLHAILEPFYLRSTKDKI